MRRSVAIAIAGRGREGWEGSCPDRMGHVGINEIFVVGIVNVGSASASVAVQWLSSKSARRFRLVAVGERADAARRRDG